MQKFFTNFSLYIHIPFCSRKCLFCSFPIAVGQNHRREEYVSALIKEMQAHGGKKLDSIYFGGGTPSMLEENDFDRLMEALRKNFLFTQETEITVEANPESINGPKAKFLNALGVNRISLGLQSMNDGYLKFLGRNHDRVMAICAYNALRDAGFNNMNVDLMYGFPGQTTGELEEDIRSIAQLESQHLSLYSLTIEPQSRFFASQLKLDDDEKLAEAYVMIGQLLEGYGFHQYEVSNFAKNGFESRHNKNYWLGGPYLGLGMGAHGFDGRRRYWNAARLQDYLERAHDGKSMVEGYEDLTDEQLIMEKVLFGLRMNEGISREMVPLKKNSLIETWIKDGFLETIPPPGGGMVRLRVTPQGRLILDELSSRLI